MKELVEEEEALLAFKGGLPEDNALIAAKKDGFSDKYLSQILEVDEDEIRNKRISLGVEETWEGVHVSGTQDRAYYYSTYNGTDKNPISEEKPKIMILGGGPNRIGQGIEFDYCCVHASLALKKLGFETIIVNCNPETVSTDYDTSDKLYFEPLTLEDVLSIYKKEKPVRSDRAVRRTDSAEPCGRSGKKRREDLRYGSVCYRSGGRPRSVP